LAFNLAAFELEPSSDLATAQESPRP